ncbi:MAG: cytochrome c3 [Firmicutes bacterium]|nr:cytochrome c3 [Bacillota bacterium]
MEGQDSSPKGFRERFLNKRVILIAAAVVLILGGGTGAALVKASDNPSFCNNCHIMKPYYESWNSGNLLANKHAAAGVDCHACHESSISVQASEGIKYITGDYKEPLEKRVFYKQFCLDCHSEAGIGAVKGTTFEQAKLNTSYTEKAGVSNPHDSHIGEQECNVCHNMHQQSNMMCAECHANSYDWIDNLDSSWKTAK